MSAVSGAKKGAAAGPEGAVLGAALGALTGSKGHPRGQGKRALVGEFLLCAVITLIGGLSGGGQPGPWMKKFVAIGAVYAILSFIAEIGQTPKRVANGLGLLVFLAVVIADDKVLGNLLNMINNAHAPAVPSAGSSAAAAAGTSDSSGGATTPDGHPESLQEQIEPGGGIAADAGTAVHDWIVGEWKNLFG